MKYFQSFFTYFLLNPNPVCLLLASRLLCRRCVCLTSPTLFHFSNGYCRLVIHPKLSKVSVYAGLYGIKYGIG